MEMIEAAIEHLPRFATVLVACHSRAFRHDLVEKLQAREISILGPAYTSDQALTLASHAGADLAIVETPIAEPGRVDALVRQLDKIWGIRSVLLPAQA